MKNSIFKSVAAVVALMLATADAGAAAAASSYAAMTVDNTTTVNLNYVSSSCIGTIVPSSWPTPITSGNSSLVTATSTTTSNGCSVTYKKADGTGNCKWVATRIESGLPPAAWNYPTVNITTTGSITCTDTITSVLTNGDWAVTLKAH